MARDLPHLLIPGRVPSEPYRPHPRGGDKPKTWTPPDPELHGRNLRVAIETAAREAHERRESSALVVAGAKPGVCLVFTSPPDIRLALASLEAKKPGIEILGVRQRVLKDETVEELATVFVPEGKLGHFLDRFDQYVSEKTEKGARRHEALVQTLASIKLASLRALWTENDEAFPPDGLPTWWEVWLRMSDGEEEARLTEYAAKLELELGSRRLTFPDRIVRTLRATPAQLASSIDVLGDLAELRLARELAAVFVTMPATEQADWAKDLSDRLDAAPPDAPVVCILDTGVNRGHPLLAASLAPEDLHACEPSWLVADHHGHGTEMAGLALLGDVRAALGAVSRIQLQHRLESVKILPPTGANNIELWGTITGEAVSRAEIQAPNRRRTISLSIAANNTRARGLPTSWSAAVDALAAGRAIIGGDRGLDYLDRAGTNPRRLFVICAGNVDSMQRDYIERNDLETIHDPGQAWNALTVGACTRLVELDPDNPTNEGITIVAAAGDLSPYSSTSVNFLRPWPLKPDVVFEGGNKGYDDSGSFQHDELSLTTTSWKPAERLFTSTMGTSAATAQVSRMAAEIAAIYPNLWPETIRALIVSSAEWTERMLARAGLTRTRSQKESTLLRRFGFGEPSVLRATKSAKSALTLIVQDTLRPFVEGKLREMNVHNLPWPREALLDLGETPVSLRITLSYFIEPNPARRGWRNRYRYASHGLRFDVMKPTESISEFKKRLNHRALDEDEEKTSSVSDAADWLVGPDLRHHGSLHCDIWKGTAVDLAERAGIGIFPVAGWWKDQPKQDCSEDGVRYALAVTLTTPEIDVDLWTPVASQIGVMTPVVTET